MTNQSVSLPDRPKRSLILRMLFGFLWFVLFYFITNMLVGGIVGGIAGASGGRDSAAQTFSQGFEAGKYAGRQATAEFFHRYGLLILLAQVLVFAILCVFSVLPGVGRYKKLKKA
jgi:membrane protein YqaA with SNARE-associated domain